MFEKRRCPNCERGIKDDFMYCPYCGEELREAGDGFGGFGLFEGIDKEFQRIDKIFEPNVFKVQSRPARGGGISITINSVSGKPKVEVRTSGDYRKVEPQIKRRLKVAPSQHEDYEESNGPVRTAKTTEEPEVRVEKVGDGQIISMRLPGVKEKDLEVRRLEQSLEIKAFAGDKAFFKLIPIKHDANISSRFKEGLLRIEIGK
jgi:HSP20 family molecular chaperone IbpA